MTGRWLQWMNQAETAVNTDGSGCATPIRDSRRCSRECNTVAEAESGGGFPGHP
ncbi:hypothetical protein Pd630_LPD05994 [Rhodococcus opacus PD630]|nr:hypothetical protein Pd630_LPD05994 [Rhodococcus opacus PD630]